MVQYKCERCLCTFNKKSSYDDHLNIKIPCKVVKMVYYSDDIINILQELGEVKNQLQNMNKMEEQIKELKKETKGMKKTLTKSLKRGNKKVIILVNLY